MTKFTFFFRLLWLIVLFSILFIDRDNRLYCEMWSGNKKGDKTEWNVTSNIYGKDYFTQNVDSILHLTMVHDKENKILKFSK